MGEGTGTYTFKSTGMKLFGEWAAGQITQGRWIYPNGMYYEGGFQNNKPDGEGKWVFKNGNILGGEYKQKEVVVEDDGGDDEGGAKKPKYELMWNSHTNIADSAHKVNSVEQ